MIYTIWYPSGGFGHFLNAIISLRGKNFVRPANSLTFSKDGDSHSLQLVAPKIHQGTNSYQFNFCRDQNYTILVDNGITDESYDFVNLLPSDQVKQTIKIIYSDKSWPIIAETMSVKAMRSSINDVAASNYVWPTDDNWAIRERYFLFLRDNILRTMWKESQSKCINIDSFNDYNKLFNSIANCGINLDSFNDLYQEWYKHNQLYFTHTTTADSVINALRANQDVSLSSINNVWTQAVIYYYIWLEFGVEVPHNDYQNFFTNTKEIATMLKQHGVNL